ncbi:MAG: penicillin-binding protein, partial [Clostridia bacterium]|nr:penicillin-binding protein [Clostridia bacterium]
KIYTYLDCGLQKELEKQAENCPTDKSFCVIDNATCGVKAFYSTIGNAKRLPASAIKPLLVYAPALQENIISPATPVLDEKIDYAGYSPQNYGGEYHGYVSAREALAKSYNVPTVKILNTLNVKKGAEYLKKMNLSVKNEDLSLALALGGMQEGFALKDLVGAYTTFANQGNFTPCAFIEKITDSRGNLLFEGSKKSKKVFDFDSVTLLNDMLQTAVQSGTAKKLSGLPYEVCAKTGTGANANGNTDAYCVAYTSADTIGVWLGNADGSSIENITGGGLPANINLNVQKYLYQNTSPAEFKKSDGVIRCSLDKLEYEKNHALFLSDVNAPIQEKTFSELFKKNFAPKKSSTYFSRPKLQNVGISCQNDGILLQLCHAEYLTIIINREESGEFKTIYQGECVENWLDEDVEEGKTYEYSITPYYKEFAGDTMVLPKVQYKKKSSADAVDKAPLNSIIPREWWR